MITQKIIFRHEGIPDLDHLVVAGVDEAGRGALAGPLVASAVVLGSGCQISGCKDSKQLTPSKRNQLAAEIKTQSLSWTTAQASAEEVDRLNVLRATLLAMRRAIDALSVVPDIVLIDGNHCPETEVPCCAIIGGDARVMVISAASILAKTTRDKKMENLHQRYPVYNFKAHKGYPTAEHLNQLDQNGHCAIHRRSYKPVRQRCLFND